MIWPLHTSPAVFPTISPFHYISVTFPSFLFPKHNSFLVGFATAVPHPGTLVQAFSSHLNLWVLAGSLSSQPSESSPLATTALVFIPFSMWSCLSLPGIWAPWGQRVSLSGSAAYSWCRDWWAWHKIGIDINQWVSKWMYVPVVLRLERMWESPEACQNTDCWPDPQNSWVGRSGVRPPNLHFSQVTPAHGNSASQTTSPPGPASRVCLHLAGGSGMWSELHEKVRCLWKWSQIWLLCSTRL